MCSFIFAWRSAGVIFLETRSSVGGLLSLSHDGVFWALALSGSNNTDAATPMAMNGFLFCISFLKTHQWNYLHAK